MGYPSLPPFKIKNRIMETFIVMRHGRGGFKLFLINRNITKKRWWTTDTSEAIQFRKKSAAEYSARHLRFGDPEVITFNEALEFEAENDHLEAGQEHPFADMKY